MPGEPKGEWVPDNDDEPDGFLGTSLVFWDMKWKEVLSQKNAFQQSPPVTRKAYESPLGKEGSVISRSYKQPRPKKESGGHRSQ